MIGSGWCIRDWSRRILLNTVGLASYEMEIPSVLYSLVYTICNFVITYLYGSIGLAIYFFFYSVEFWRIESNDEQKDFIEYSSDFYKRI